MKKFFLIISLFVSIPLLSQHSIGLESGVNIYGGTFMGTNKEKQTLFINIPYEYHWTKNVSWIAQIGYSQNSDFFNLIRYLPYPSSRNDEFIRAETEVDFFRASLHFSRKFGFKNKIYGVYRLGTGIGFIPKINYSIMEQDDNASLLYSGSTKYNGIEIFSEFSLGFGWEINEKFGIELNMRTLIGLHDLNFIGEPIFNNSEDLYSYKDYYSTINFTNVGFSYRTRNFGVGLKLIRYLNTNKR